MPLPDLDSEVRVDARTIASFRRDGHVAIRALATPEELRPHRAAVATALAEAKKERASTKTKRFLRLTNLWCWNEAARRLIFSRRFAGAAAQFLGVPSVRLYCDQAIFKIPGGKRTPWHRDRSYFPLATELSLTLWLPLVDVTKTMGPICFATGSHKTSSADDEAWVGTAPALTARIGRRWPVAALPLRLGDASFHLSGALHSAASNRSRKMREVVTVAYYPTGTRIAEPTTNDHIGNLDTFFPGARPGEEASNEMHPILYG